MTVKSQGYQRPLLILALLFFLPGCVAANTGNNPGVQAVRPNDEIAALVAENGVGSRQISLSPFGAGTASLGEAYFSALGVPCRKVIFSDYSGRRHNLAVCAESGGGDWVTAPDIFGYFNNQ